MKEPIPNDGDEVGYGKPPKHAQFKKGQSGNPNGRPKKKKSVKDLFEEAWQTEVKVNGTKMTKAELFINQLVNDGIKGKASARNLLMAHLPEMNDELEEFEPSFDDKIEMIKTIRRFEARERNQSEEDAS